MKRPFPFSRCIRPAALLAFTALLALPPAVPAQFTGPEPAAKSAMPPVDLRDPEGLGKNGDAAFANEEWLKAAANYNALITIGRKVGVPQEQLEPLYYMVGLTLFLSSHEIEALKHLKEYETLFPKDSKIDQVKLAIARCLRAQKKWAEAIPYYKPLSGKGSFREDVLVELAEAYRDNNEPDKAITFLDTKLATGLKNREDVRAALVLADLRAASPDKALAWLEKVKPLPAATAFVAEANLAAMKCAEVQMQAEKFKDALPAFQRLRQKNDVLTSLETRVREYEEELGELSAKKEAKGLKGAPVLLRIHRLKGLLEDTKRLSAAVAREAEYDAVFTYRKGRCLAALQRYEEAGAAFQDVYTRYPKFTDRPNVLYALAYCHYMQVPDDPAKDDLKKVDAADQLLAEFLNQWGRDRSESSQVADMRIQLATRTKDSARLNKVLEELDSQLKGSPSWSCNMVQYINALLGQKEFAKAKTLIEKFLTLTAPDDPHRKEVEELKKQIPEQK